MLFLQLVEDPHSHWLQAVGSVGGKKAACNIELQTVIEKFYISVPGEAIKNQEPPYPLIYFFSPRPSFGSRSQLQQSQTSGSKTASWEQANQSTREKPSRWKSECRWKECQLKWRIQSIMIVELLKPVSDCMKQTSNSSSDPAQDSSDHC